MPGASSQRKLTPNQQARRSRILTAAQALLGEHGYDGMIMRDVAARAGVSPTTLYNLYNTKDELLLEALRSIPFDSQVVLELSYWERLTGTEIGEVLELPLGTVKTRVRRAKQLLQERLQALGESAEVLESTMSNLDDWATSLRDLVSR